MSDFDAAVKLLATECQGIQRDEPELGMEAIVRHVLSAAAQDVTLAPILTQTAWKPEDGDTKCQRCQRSNVVWVADSALWNEVTDEREAILCLRCFAELCEERLDKPILHVTRLIGTDVLPPTPERSIVSSRILRMVEPCPVCGRPVFGGQKVARRQAPGAWQHEPCFDGAEAVTR